MIDDVYALLSWLEELSLDAHNKANSPYIPKRGCAGVTGYERHGYKMQKEAYDRVITYVKTMGKRSK